MTIKDAKTRLIVLACMCEGKDFYDEVDAEALKLAIRSLNAWEKLIKFADLEQENNGTLRVHINDIKKFYKEVEE